MLVGNARKSVGRVRVSSLAISWATHFHAALVSASCQPPNKQLQRTVPRYRGRGARASFHYARAPRCISQRAAAELRR